MKTQRLLWLVPIVLLLAGVGFWLWSRQDRRAIQPATPRPAPSTARPGAAGTTQAEPLDQRSPETILDQLREDARVGQQIIAAPPVEPPKWALQLTKSTNPGVAGVITALEDGNAPERLTPTSLPQAFDREAYEKAPDAYINSVEPGRVWQSAQPGPGVKHLKRLAPMRLTVKQKESVRLAVGTEPGAPVTFTSFDLGVFSNQLPSQTVRASEQGVAEAVFTGIEGTVNDVHITAASPMSSGRVEFVVYVSPPQPPDATQVAPSVPPQPAAQKLPPASVSKPTSRGS